MTRGRHARRTLLPFLVLSLAVGYGCAEFGDPWTGVPAGRIEGHVTTGASPVEAEIRFERLNGDDQERFAGSIEVEDNGSYGVDVPAGAYLVSLRVNGTNATIYHAEPHPVYEEAEADTVLVATANSPVRLEFALGGLDLDLTLPPGLEGYDGYVDFHVPGDDGSGDMRTSFTSQRAEVENGWILLPSFPLVPGEYLASLAIEAPWNGSYSYACERVWLPGTRGAAGAMRFDVVAGTITRVTCPVAVEPLRVAGRVGGAWLELGATNKPELWVVDPDSLALIDRLAVDEDGAFGFDLLLPAEFKLRVAHYSETGSWFGGPSFESAEVFNLGPGESLTDLEYLQCGLRLRIADPPTGYGDAQCCLYDETGTDLFGRHFVNFSDNYQLGIPNLNPGTYLLRIEYREGMAGNISWLPQWFDLAATPAAARPILLAAPGEIVTLELAFEAGGVISGRLELPASPADYFYAFVYPESPGPEWGHTAVSNTNHEFKLLGLPDGRYKLGAVSSDLYWDATGSPPPGTTWYPATPDWDAAGVIEIVDAATVSGLAIVIPGA